ncbi:MAG: tRNA-binding protein [Dehalococcoidia bacterium]|nr:MAG: tRNA-binding protein [Dehalococcoidia bacterium]
MTQISYDYFEKVDIRVGKIIKAEDFPKARKPAYKLWIDFGDLGLKKASAQITNLYTKDDLIGRRIIAVVNFPPRQIADFMSEVLVLGVVLDNDEVVLVQPDSDVPLGKRIL